MRKVTFGEATPQPKNNRLNWTLSDMPASEVLNPEVRLSKTEKPYVIMNFNERANLCALVEQLLFDQENSKVKFITSKEDDDIEIDLDVKVGVKNGAFFFA